MALKKLREWLDENFWKKKDDNDSDKNLENHWILTINHWKFSDNNYSICYFKFNKGTNGDDCLSYPIEIF